MRLRKTYQVGDRYRNLTIIRVELVEGKRKSVPITIIHFVCDCGNIGSLKQEQFTKKYNCGCKKGNSKYGIYNKRVYSIWRQMKIRCFYKNCANYYNYGGRGIVVCDGFLDFIQFSKSVGNPPTDSHSIDRIDNDGNYSCGKCEQCIKNGWSKNVRWATHKEQSSNTRACYKINIDGNLVTLKEACRIKNLPYKQVHERVKRGGWDIDIALNTPVINKTNIRYKKLIK